MAGLGRKEWSPGDVLTASDVNGYLMDQSVMVFAGTAARASAIPTPSAGMVAYSTATNLEYYNGSAWEAVSPVSSNGLELITAQPIGTAVSTVTVTNVFSSTYENYKIVLSGGTGSVNNEVFQLQLGATTTGYYAAYSGVTYSTGAASPLSDNNTASWSRFAVIRTAGIVGSIELLSPNLAKNTYIVGSQITDSLSRSGTGYLNNTTVYTDFTFTPGTGTVTGGTIFVYGYVKV